MYPTNIQDLFRRQTELADPGDCPPSCFPELNIPNFVSAIQPAYLCQTTNKPTNSIVQCRTTRVLFRKPPLATTKTSEWIQQREPTRFSITTPSSNNHSELFHFGPANVSTIRTSARAVHQHHHRSGNNRTTETVQMQGVRVTECAEDDDTIKAKRCHSS